LDESLSGSDDSGSESDDDSRHQNVLVSLLKKQALSGTAASHEDVELSNVRQQGSGKSPFFWFSTPALPPNNYLGIYKAIFTAAEQKNEAGLVEAVVKKQLSPMPQLKLRNNTATGLPQPTEEIGPHIFMCMIGGGHFAAMVVSLTPKPRKSSTLEPFAKEAIVLAHKTFHRYTTRRKQGGSQSANDSAKGAAHSAGAGIRRYNEAALIDDVRGLLAEWKSLIDSSELLFVRATGKTNRQTLFGPYDNQVLRQNDVRVRNFPFNTRRATQKELMRAFVELTRVKVQEIDESSTSFSERAETPAKEAGLKKTSEKSKESVVPNLSEEEETALLQTGQIQAFIRRSKLPALLSYLKANSLPPDFRFYPFDAQQNHHAPTPLHLAASLNNPTIVTGLMVKAEASPDLLNGEGKVPFDLAGDRPTRDAFRLARNILSRKPAPARWDWEKSHIPSPLTQAEVESRNSHENAKVKQEEEERRKAEEERLKREGPKVGESGPLGKSAEKGRALALGAAQKTAQERREEEGRGLTPEMRMKIERERRARAAEERFKKMQSGPSGS
jgi:hypothetical protein